MLLLGTQCAILYLMIHYQWNNEKNNELKDSRGIGFEQVILHIEQGNVLKIIQHPNQQKYPEQKILILNINNYAYLIPFVEHKNIKFLKTIIPSRNATRDYLGDHDEKTKA